MTDVAVIAGGLAVAARVMSAVLTITIDPESFDLNAARNRDTVVYVAWALTVAAIVAAANGLLTACAAILRRMAEQKKSEGDLTE